jgi:thiol-disulfide isomerase/thioredoxin
MSTRLAVLLGLFAGILTAVVAAALVVALGPEVPLVPQPGPTTQLSTPPPSGSAASLPPPSAAEATPLPTASGSAGASDARLAFHVGEPAPPLRVEQLGGGTIDLSVLRGHPVWIEFMATWCPSCRDEFPLMSGFAARYADKGLVILAIDVREDEGTVAAFVNQVVPTFPIGLDPEASAARAWDANGLPTHFFVDADGIVRDGAVGGIGPDLMAASLEQIMPGVTVTP